MQGAAEKGMTIIVKTIPRLTLGFILLYGIYITLNGHSRPGGGFAGGVIIALSFIHIMLAFGKDAALKRFDAEILRYSVCLAAILFLCVVMKGFFSFEIFKSEIVLPLCEMVIVGAARQSPR